MITNILRFLEKQKIWKLLLHKNNTFILNTENDLTIKNIIYFHVL